MRFLLTLLLLVPVAAAATTAYQPPGANLTLGNVTHGLRVQSAAGNPAGAAADRARARGESVSGMVGSLALGIEYGNVEDLFALYDSVVNGYSSSPDAPDDGDPGAPPPDNGPDEGIDLGDVWDSLDPQIQETVEAAATEVAIQAVLLKLIRDEGYARAWITAEIPIVLDVDFLGGSWDIGLRWSGASKAAGITHELEFNRAAARQALEDWVADLGVMVPMQRPAPVQLSDDVELVIDTFGETARVILNNDSSLLTKATKMTEIDVSYSRQLFERDAGKLFVGVETNLYLMDMARVSVRFGDITNTEELFDDIRNGNFERDVRVGFDLGLLWVADNYQLGAQIINVNEPNFTFPDINLEPYRDEGVIKFLQEDQIYQMNRQVNIEGSLFTQNRRWSAHLGVALNPVTDPLGDEYEWATVGVAWNGNNFWAPNVRLGYRRNLSGTELDYLSLGLTLFRYVNVDVASAMNTVSIDGTTLPQGLMGSLGFQITW